MQIGNLNLDGQVLSAPLAGVSNPPFRILARAFGAAVTYTEMISSEGLIRNQKKTRDMAAFGPEERPIGIQLFGADPEVMERAASIVAQEFKPDLIDLNFGCPVKKVVNKNGGAAVLKDLGLTEALIRATVSASGDIPVTIKIRSGWDDTKPVYVEVGKIAERSGAAAVTLHARSRSGGFSGKADWSTIGRLKASVGITVIGNGDVVSGADTRRMLDETGCDGVMIGRASLGNPAIFEEVNHFLATGEALPPKPLSSKFDLLRRHARLMIEAFGEDRAMRKMRKYFGWYIRGYHGASELRKSLIHVSSLVEMDEKIKNSGLSPDARPVERS